MKKYLVVALAAAVAAIAVVVGWKLFNRPTPPAADNPIALTDSIAAPADTVAPIDITAPAEAYAHSDFSAIFEDLDRADSSAIFEDL